MSNVFGARIRARLRQLGHTQRWLAQQVDLPDQTISNIINGRWENSGSITNAVPIAKALKTSVDYLFGLTSDPEKPIYASRPVRRLARVAERLPENEVERLINEIRSRVEVQRQDLWRREAQQAFEELLRRFGSVEAFLDWMHSVQPDPDFALPTEKESLEDVPDRSDGSDLPLFAIEDRIPASVE